MRPIFAEKSLPVCRSPLYGSQQQSIAAAEGEELLLGTCAETLFAHHLSSIALQQGRSDNLSCARRTRVNQGDKWSREHYGFGISRKTFQGFPFPADGFSYLAVFNKKVCHRHGFRQRTACSVAQIDNNLLGSLLHEVLNASTSVGRFTIGEAVNPDNSDSPRFHSRLCRRSAESSPLHRYRQRTGVRSQYSQFHLRPGSSIQQLFGVVERNITSSLAIDVFNNVTRSDARKISG